MPWKKILTGLTIVSLFIGILGGLWQYDLSKADASEVLVVKEEIRLMQKKYETEMYLMKEEFDNRDDTMRMRDLDNRIWTLRNRYEGIPLYEVPISVKEEIHRLEMELSELKNK